MQHQQYDGVILEDKWGKTYLCSTCLLAYHDFGQNSVSDISDAEFGRYFLHDLEPQWNRRQIWADMYQQARPWQSDISGLSDYQLRDAVLSLLANNEMWVWPLTDGWGKAPEGNGIGEGGLAPATTTTPAKSNKAAKPKGGALTADNSTTAKVSGHEVADHEVTQKISSPNSLSDCAKLLAESREKLSASKTYNPSYSSEELREMAEAGVVAKERFLVSLQKIKESSDSPVGYARPSQRTTAWTTTFGLAVSADTDPELLCDLNGMIFDPNAEYELVIIDQGVYYQEDGAVNFVPTYKRLGDLGKTEFASQFQPNEIDSVLNPEYSAHYAQVMEEYTALGGKPWEETKLDRFLEEKYAGDLELERKFKVRNAFNTELGANEYFSGDGVTKTTGTSAYNLEPGKNGNLEMILFERSPQSIKDLEKKGAILRVPAKPIFVKG